MDEEFPESLLMSCVGNGSGSLADCRNEPSLTILFPKSFTTLQRSSVLVLDSGSSWVSLSASEYQGMVREYGMVGEYLSGLGGAVMVDVSVSSSILGE